MIFRNLIEIRISKRRFEFFGWQFIGGNKVGIFVKSVENHLAAFKAKIEIGWKLLEVGGFLFKFVNLKIFKTLVFFSCILKFNQNLPPECSEGFHFSVFIYDIFLFYCF